MPYAFHLATIFKYVAVKISVQQRDTTSTGRRIPLKQNLCTFDTHISTARVSNLSMTQDYNRYCRLVRGPKVEQQITNNRPNYRVIFIVMPIHNLQLINTRTAVDISIVWILSSSEMLLSLGWFRTDVSELRIGPIFKGKDVQEGYFDPWRRDR